MTRDLTAKQFAARLAHYGMKPTGFLGYVVVYEHPGGKGRSCACAENAGPRRRDQLRYLLRERERAIADHEERIKVKTA